MAKDNLKIVATGQRRQVTYNGWDQIRLQDNGIFVDAQVGSPTMDYDLWLLRHTFSAAGTYNMNHLETYSGIGEGGDYVTNDPSDTAVIECAYGNASGGFVYVQGASDRTYGKEGSRSTGWLTDSSIVREAGKVHVFTHTWNYTGSSSPTIMYFDASNPMHPTFGTILGDWRLVPFGPASVYNGHQFKNTAANHGYSRQETFPSRVNGDTFKYAVVLGGWNGQRHADDNGETGVHVFIHTGSNWEIFIATPYLSVPDPYYHAISFGYSNSWNFMKDWKIPIGNHPQLFSPDGGYKDNFVGTGAPVTLDLGTNTWATAFNSGITKSGGSPTRAIAPVGSPVSITGGPWNGKVVDTGSADGLLVVNVKIDYEAYSLRYMTRPQVVFRYVDDSNYWVFGMFDIWNGTGASVTLYKVVGGVHTSMGNVSQRDIIESTLGYNYLMTFHVAMRGSYIELFYNHGSGSNTQDKVGGVINDTAHQTATKHGFRICRGAGVSSHDGGVLSWNFYPDTSTTYDTVLDGISNG